MRGAYRRSLSGPSVSLHSLPHALPAEVEGDRRGTREALREARASSARSRPAAISPAGLPADARDEVHLDGSASGESRHEHGRARGTAVANPLGINGIHRREIFALRHVDRRLHDVGPAEAFGLQDSFEVVEDAVHGLLDGPGQHRARLRVAGDLPGREEEAAFHDRLRVGSRGLRSAVGRDGAQRGSGGFCRGGRIRGRLRKGAARCEECGKGEKRRRRDSHGGPPQLVGWIKRVIAMAVRAVMGPTDFGSAVSSGECRPSPVTPSPSTALTRLQTKFASPKPLATGSLSVSAGWPRARPAASTSFMRVLFPSVTENGGTRSSNSIFAEAFGRLAATISRMRPFAASRPFSSRARRSPFTVADLETTLYLPADVPALFAGSYATSVPPRNRPGLTVTLPEEKRPRKPSRIREAS